LKNTTEIIKNELGIPAENKVILFSGKYIQKKRPLDLLKAFEQLSNKNYSLLMMGEGELRNEMEQYIANKQLKNVQLTGFVNQTDIPKYYTVADIFVMCSGAGETWGLSVNEAMNFELPVIVSRTCGSAHNLINEGVNGYAVDEGDITGLSQAIDKVLSNDIFIEQAGLVSANLVKEYNIEKIAANIKAAL
jgi:glycosyltransferase involved in cell wall biosynthesis